jgi:hypothetical protein
MDQQAVIAAIQKKYNLSADEARQVLDALVKAESQPKPKGVRAAARGVDLLALAGSLLGGKGEGKSPLAGVVADLLGGGKPQEAKKPAGLTDIVVGLLGGSDSKSSGGFDFGSLVGGLLSSGIGEKIVDKIGDVVGDILDGDKPKRRRKKPASSSSTSDRKKKPAKKPARKKPTSTRSKTTTSDDTADKPKKPVRRRKPASGS